MIEKNDPEPARERVRFQAAALDARDPNKGAAASIRLIQRRVPLRRFD
jgi:hypothetical protein